MQEVHAGLTASEDLDPDMLQDLCRSGATSSYARYRQCEAAAIADPSRQLPKRYQPIKIEVECQCRVRVEDTQRNSKHCLLQYKVLQSLGRSLI